MTVAHPAAPHAAAAAAAAAVVGRAGSQRRRRLDQIPAKWHCSVIGTCLPLAELRKIAVRMRFDLPRDASDYQVHGAVVHSAGGNKALARMLTRALDKRFPAQIARFSRATTDEELATLWREHCDRGDVPGAFWALMSHPADCHALRDRAYGEVHMLSHLSGASQRVDIRRQAELERTLAARTAEVEALAAERCRWRETESRLRHDLATLDLHRRRSMELEARLAEMESGAAMTDLRGKLAAAQAEADRLTRVAGRLEARAVAAEEEAARQEAANGRLRSRIADLELRLCEVSACRLRSDGGARAPDLGRRRILYVGGMTRAVSHMRDLVTRHNGEFLHHDGGLEDGCARLTGALAQADAVLCPVTCVSHDAVDHIKRDCRRACKHFMPLPSHSVSAFMRALRVLGDPEAAAGARREPPPAAGTAHDG